MSVGMKLLLETLKLAAVLDQSIECRSGAFLAAKQGHVPCSSSPSICPWPDTRLI